MNIFRVTDELPITHPSKMGLGPFAKLLGGIGCSIGNGLDEWSDELEAELEEKRKMRKIEQLQREIAKEEMLRRRQMKNVHPLYDNDEYLELLENIKLAKQMERESGRRLSDYDLKKMAIYDLYDDYDFEDEEEEDETMKEIKKLKKKLEKLEEKAKKIEKKSKKKKKKK